MNARVAAAPDRLPPVSPGIPRRRWSSLGRAYLLLGAGAFVLGPLAGPDGWWLHGLWCVLGLLIALPTLLIPLRADFALTLTEHRLAFLTAFCLFLLFGASYPVFGSESGVSRAMQHYPIDAMQALRVDAVNGLGFGLALIVSARASGRWFGAMTARFAARVARVPVRRIIQFTVIVGGGATAWRLYYTWGYLEGTLSGIWTMAGQLLLVAILLLAAAEGRRERSQRRVAVLMALSLSLVGSLQFMKQSMLEPLVALLAGLALRFGARRVLPVGLAGLVLLFVVLGDVVSQGRQAGGFYAGEITLAERWEFMREGWRRSRELSEDQRFSSWARFSQVFSEAAGMAFYDAGEGANGEPALYWVFVPRFLASEKPAFTIGTDVYEKITGRTDSSDAIGVFASGYYYAGGWGVLIASLIAGWIVAQTSAIAQAIQRAQAIGLLPLTLLGLFISLSVTVDFISGFLGAFMYVAYVVVIGAVTVTIFAPVRSAGGRP